MSESLGLKFIADENVGKLAKLLRLLGFDNAFFSQGSDSRLVEVAIAEQRIIITRDTRIQERRILRHKLAKLILIRSEQSTEQLKQLAGELELWKGAQPFSMCLECNQRLSQIDREMVQTRVPAYVIQTQNDFQECPYCRRIYWKGTHWLAMHQKLIPPGK
jgi:uncharacterized protein